MKRTHHEPEDKPVRHVKAEEPEEPIETAVSKAAAARNPRRVGGTRFEVSNPNHNVTYEDAKDIRDTLRSLPGFGPTGLWLDPPDGMGSPDRIPESEFPDFNPPLTDGERACFLFTFSGDQEAAQNVGLVAEWLANKDLIQGLKQLYAVAHPPAPGAVGNPDAAAAAILGIPEVHDAAVAALQKKLS